MKGCTTRAMDEAAGKGHLEVVKFLDAHRKEGCTSNAMINALVHGHFHVVEWLSNHRMKGYLPRALNYAASNGNLDVVRWLSAKRSKDGMSLAPMDHFKLIQGLHRPEPWTDDGVASPEDVVECLTHHRYEFSNVVSNVLASAEKNTMDLAAECGQFKAARLVAAGNGHVQVVQWLHAHRSEGCTAQAMDRAAKGGHLHVVEWLDANRSEGCTVFAMDIAAWRGDLTMLQWLHSHRTEGCTIRAVEHAKWNCHAHVLEWLVENCPEFAHVDVLALGNRPSPGSRQWWRLD